MKNLRDLRANLISTKVSASHRKSTQVHASPGQTESQVDASRKPGSTCDSVWPVRLLVDDLKCSENEIDHRMSVRK